MKRLVVLFLAGLLASVASAKDIIPGVGCGNLRLGLTAREVTRMLGKPESTNDLIVWHYRGCTISVRFDAKTWRVDELRFNIGRQAGKNSPNTVKGPHGTVSLGEKAERVIRAFGPIRYWSIGGAKGVPYGAPTSVYLGKYTALSYPLEGVVFLVNKYGTMTQVRLRGGLRGKRK